jgi:hypothetical protein
VQFFLLAPIAFKRLDKRNSLGTRIGWTLLVPVAVDGEKSMTVNTTNRSRRVAYLVLLLMVTVALTSALVLAGERGWNGEKKEVSLRIPSGTQTTNPRAELMGCPWA